MATVSIEQAVREGTSPAALLEVAEWNKEEATRAKGLGQFDRETRLIRQCRELMNTALEMTAQGYS